jgi:hypothetical protein
MATYGYDSVNRKSCGYRNLATYYSNLYGNVTNYDANGNIVKATIAVAPQFGGIPNEGYQVNSSSAVVAGKKCDTWRSGQCCDGRVLSKSAYTQCEDGLCPGYSNLAYTSRY